MKKLTALLLGALVMCWTAVALAAYQVPRQLNDSVYPDFARYRVEYLPSVATITQTGSGVWSITLDRNPYAHADAGEVAFCLNFDSPTNPQANYFDYNQLKFGSFTRSGNSYTAQFVMPEEAKLYGCTDFAFCELTVLSFAGNSSCWFKTEYRLGTTTNGTISFNVDEEQKNYELTYRGGWVNQVTAYDEGQRIDYYYANGVLQTSEIVYGVQTSASWEETVFRFDAKGAFLSATYYEARTGRTYHYDNDGKGWYYYTGNQKTYTAKPHYAIDPAEKVPSLAPSTPGTADFAPGDVSTNNPLGKLAIYKNGKLVDYTGFAQFDGADFYFEHGVVRDDLAGVVHLNGVWYAFDFGRLMRDEMLVPFESGVFFFNNGVIDQSKSGLVTFNGERFAFAYGQYQPAANGAWMNPNDGLWYYMVNGQFVPTTALVRYDGAMFYFIDGQLATWFTGTVKDADGTEYRVQGGQVL